MNETIEIKGLKFVLTCEACPEQYDVYYEEQQVGYVRLRYGIIAAYYPNCGGKQVYIDAFSDHFKECFNSYKERMLHINKIADAFLEEINDDEDHEEMDFVQEHEKTPINLVVEDCDDCDDNLKSYVVMLSDACSIRIKATYVQWTSGPIEFVIEDNDGRQIVARFGNNILGWVEENHLWRKE